MVLGLPCMLPWWWSSWLMMVPHGYVCLPNGLSLCVKSSCTHLHNCFANSCRPWCACWGCHCCYRNQNRYEFSTYTLRCVSRIQYRAELDPKYANFISSHNLPFNCLCNSPCFSVRNIDSEYYGQYWIGSVIGLPHNLNSTIWDFFRAKVERNYIYFFFVERWGFGITLNVLFL